MVKTAHPTQLKYINKFSLLMFVLFSFIPFTGSFWQSYFSWKRGKLPRMQHMDDCYTKYAHNGRGYRFKYLLNPGLTAYPDNYSYAHMKTIKTFIKKHRMV
jgi:hypothetical protein